MLGSHEKVYMTNINQIFSDIYSNNRWDCGSGPGSLPEATVQYRDIIKKVIADHNVNTVLDYGCGDWQFSQLLNWTNLVENYIGADVVESLIINHNSKFQKENVKFELINDQWTWPTVDLIVCKDVLQHLSNSLIEQITNNMKNHSRLILITNDITSPKNKKIPNSDCNSGEWRPLDLSEDPWNFSCEKLLTWSVRNRTKQTILIKNF